MKCRPLFFPYVALDPLRAPDGKSVRARARAGWRGKPRSATAEESGRSEERGARGEQGEGQFNFLAGLFLTFKRQNVKFKLRFLLTDQRSVMDGITGARNCDIL